MNENSMLDESLKWYFSGQFTGHGSFSEQVTEAMTLLKKNSDAAGVPAESYLKCDISLKDPAQMDTVLQLYKKLISPKLPAVKAVVVPQIIGGTDFSIEVLGIRTDKIDRFFFPDSGIPCAVRAGDYIFTSAVEPDEAGDLDTESMSGLNKMICAVELAGGRKEDLVKNFVLLTDCSAFDAFNETYAKVFSVHSDPPARTLHGVRQTLTGRRMAVEGIAYTGSDKAFIFAGKQNGSLPFCHASKAGDLVFISGQTGIIGADGNYLLEFGAQVDRMIELVEAIYATGNFPARRFQKNSVFVSYIPGLPDLEKHYRKIYDGQDSLATVYEVTSLAYEPLLIEMDSVIVTA